MLNSPNSKVLRSPYESPTLSTSISNSPSSVRSLTVRHSSSFQQPFPASRSRRLQSSGVSRSPESFPVSAMPGKDDACSSETEKNLELFLKVGLDERTAKNTIANNKVTANLTVVIHEAAVTDGCSRTVGNLLYTDFLASAKEGAWMG
ncbi:uncharacterized protein [Pyrus communis]|uniref:uncharacterized protein n=1 Tax=Pyrus communis TaxID=23211 RepID=UPI0035C1C6F7